MQGKKIKIGEREEFALWNYDFILHADKYFLYAFFVFLFFANT
jgi:hypothetical protein